MSKLVIVESPAKAKTINKYLGRGYNVKASMGHIRDLPKTRFGVDIEHGFEPTYVINVDRKKLLTELNRAAKTADEVFLATDLDREGEAIAWHLAAALKLPKDKTRRVVFNEITKTAIREAFEHPRAIEENKVNAQQARRILDRIVGYQISPLLWKKVRYGLSAGRVQSVAVRLIVEREREIEKFRIEEYWEIDAELELLNAPGKKLKAKLFELDGDDFTLSSEAQTQQLMEELRKQKFSVSKVAVKERLLQAYPPFITSTLQQAASTQLHFSTKKTMMLAQRLYEGIELGTEGSVGLITYMRTDSLHCSTQSVTECRKYISEQFPKEYLPEHPLTYRSSKDAQAAHEAVRPTSIEYTPEKVQPFLEKDQFRLYELIWKRFLASQMMPGRLQVTDVQVAAGRALFEAQARKLLFDGHLKVSGFDYDSLLELPPMMQGDELKLLDLIPSRHETKPPPRYSEASLVKTLEKLGIGRPSTYSPIISTIQTRGYVKLLKRQFHATELGKMVTDQLLMHFADMMDVKFTSRMEARLDEVEEAKVEWRQALREFYGPFSEDMKKAGELMKRPEPTVTEYKCEKCGKPMLKRWSIRGEFFGCSGYPECRVTMALGEDGKPAPRPEPEKTDQLCEKCNSPMVIRVGRHGRFIACSGYPKCKNAKSLEPAIEIPEDLKTCEKCGKPMAVKRFRGRFFLGCSGYPECKNAKSLPKKEKEE